MLLAYYLPWKAMNVLATLDQDGDAVVTVQDGPVRPGF